MRNIFWESCQISKLKRFHRSRFDFYNKGSFDSSYYSGALAAEIRKFLHPNFRWFSSTCFRISIIGRWRAKNPDYSVGDCETIMAGDDSRSFLHCHFFSKINWIVVNRQQRFNICTSCFSSLVPKMSFSFISVIFIVSFIKIERKWRPPSFFV